MPRTAFKLCCFTLHEANLIDDSEHAVLIVFIYICNSNTVRLPVNEDIPPLLNYVLTVYAFSLLISLCYQEQDHAYCMLIIIRSRRIIPMGYITTYMNINQHYCLYNKLISSTFCSNFVTLALWWQWSHIH